MSYYTKDVPKILSTIEQAQDILHTLQWELEKARDIESRKKVIGMINSITEMWIRFSESQSSEESIPPSPPSASAKEQKQ